MTSLQRGECVQLFGPRRTGKSSLLKECARRLREEGDCIVIEVNGEGMDAVASLFNQFVGALPARSREGFMARLTAFKVPDSLLKVIESFSGQGGTDSADAQLVTRHWGSLAAAIAQLLPDMEARPVLVIDELPYLCEDLGSHSGNPDEVKRLLAMLRDWRGAGLGMAMAGSIGIRQMLRRIKVSRTHLTGCPPIHVGPLAPDDARLMLAALAAEQRVDWWNDAIGDIILEQSADLLPACLQFAFKYVVAAAEDGQTPGPDEIRRVFSDQIRPNFDHEFFHQFDERIADYDRSEQDVAHEVFRSIARSTRGSRSRAFADLADAVEAKLGPAQDRKPASADTELADLILALEDDGFLIDDRDRDQIGFASRLVEAWWRTRDHRRGRRR